MNKTNTRLHVHHASAVCRCCCLLYAITYYYAMLFVVAVFQKNSNSTVD